MSIKIEADGNLYQAEVTALHDRSRYMSHFFRKSGFFRKSWRSLRPMDMKEMSLALRMIGCDEAKIADAFRAAGAWNPSEGPFPPFMTYGQYVQRIDPEVVSALAGSREVPSQPPSSEAWLTFALYWGVESPLSLEDFIGAADSINHLIPNYDEIAWVLLRLRKRGWLSEEENTYALTDGGRQAIERIVGKGGHWEQRERLEEWISTHPP